MVRHLDVDIRVLESHIGWIAYQENPELLINRPPSPIPDVEILGQDITVACEANPKRKLNDIYGDTTVEARKRASIATEKQLKGLREFTVVMDLAGNEGCGACLMQGKILNHSPADCSRMDQSIYQLFKRRDTGIKYPKSRGWNAPCFTCHIHAMGSDKLHPRFVKGGTSCTHPNLVLPMLTQIWSDDQLKEELCQSLGRPVWSSFAEFVHWLETPLPAPTYSASMYVLQWWSTSQLDKVMAMNGV
jgi:hypothetical protein